MKPNTRIYVYLEGRDISRWVNPDLRFTGIAGNSLSAFNGPITTDEYGNASGLIILPAGILLQKMQHGVVMLDTVAV